MERNEFTMRHHPCVWCGKELGRFSICPNGKAFVHKKCDDWAWHNATKKKLDEYLARLEEF